MSEFQKINEIIEFGEKIRKKYSDMTKLLFLIGIILIIWIVIVFSGVLFWGYGYNWAGLSFETWILAISVILFAFIILEITIYYRFSNIEKQIKQKSQPEPEFINGKRVHIFSHPKGIEGGIFSKTYIEIDPHNILRLRTLMIAPGEIWSKKETKEIEK